MDRRSFIALFASAIGAVLSPVSAAQIETTTSLSAGDKIVSHPSIFQQEMKKFIDWMYLQVKTSQHEEDPDLAGVQMSIRIRSFFVSYCTKHNIDPYSLLITVLDGGESVRVAWTYQDGNPDEVIWNA